MAKCALFIKEKKINFKILAPRAFEDLIKSAFRCAASLCAIEDNAMNCTKASRAFEAQIYVGHLQYKKSHIFCEWCYTGEIITNRELPIVMDELNIL